jgi:leucyl-tRNA synthetase
MNRLIAVVTSALEEMKIRKAFSIAFLDLWNDLRWYMRRSKEWRQQTLTDVFSAWTRMLSPFVPFVAEEMNKAIGGRGLASQADWPSPKDFPIDGEAELSEVVVIRVLEDARSLLRVVKDKKQKLNIYTASEEAIRFFSEVAEARAKKKDLGSIIKAFPRVSISPDRVVKLQYDIGEDLISKYLSLPRFDEFKLVSEASDFLSEELGMEVVVAKAGSKVINDPKSRAGGALPMKPAFFLE